MKSSAFPSALLVALAFALLPGIAARAAGGPGAERTPSIRVSIETADKSEFAYLRDSALDLTHLGGNRFDALLTREQLDDLRSRGFRTTVLQGDVYRAGGGLRAAAWLPEYVSYAEAAAQLSAWAASYPTLTQLTSLGTSHEGREIWALKISDNAAIDENEPEVLIVGNHHAREVITVIVPLAVADSLLTNYGSDPQYTQWVDEREIWIVPTVNPDGLVYVETSDLFWRKNRRVNGGGSFGVDLNRNYDYEWGHDDNGSSPNPSSLIYRGPSAASEPEVQAVQGFVDSRQFVVSMSFHSFSNLILWGPGYKPALSEDEDIFRGLGELITSRNGYAPGNPASGTIYITNGDTDDWVYHAPTHSRVFGLTPEVGTSSDYFNPPAGRIPTLVIEGSECAWAAIENADRPGRLAPPGQPTFAGLPPSPDGNAVIAWNPPTTADTQVIEYELVERTGPVVVTDGLESGTGGFDLGGWSQSSARKAAGSFSLYSGSGDEINRICLAKEGYVVGVGDTFRFQAWYDIETNWDYAYVILSTDGGRSFVNLSGTGTTMSDPNGNNADNGITGSSGGWQQMTYDLSPWAGQTVWLGFRYFTDAAVTREGIYVDEIHPLQTWTTWTLLSSGIPAATYARTGLASGTYYYTARGRDAEGNWGYSSPYGVLVVDIATDVVLVGEHPAFALGSGIPNPFRGSTRITFHLPTPGHHTLSVYDVTGRRVRTLSSGMREAGRHAVRWDGRNDAGVPVSSGVYFYELSAGAGRLRERAVLRR